ncbi:MAG: GNAT family N-acetyltransferase [Phycisphaerales bacterium]
MCKMNIEGPRECFANELDETLALMDSIFHAARPRRIGKYYPFAYGQCNLDNMRIIKADGKVVSHAAIYERTVNTTNGLNLKIGCIGGVATLPEHRQKGYASIILEDCIKKMEKEDYDISLLWTGTPDFYRRLGWELAGLGCNFQINRGNVFIFPEYDEKFPLETSIEDYSEINELYNKNIFKTYRQLGDYPLLFNNQRKLYYQKNGKISGYVLIGDENIVLEYGGSVHIVAAILRRLIEKENYSSLRVFTPSQDDGLREYLKELNVPETTFYLGMIRIINENKFMEKFKIPRSQKYFLPMLSKLCFGPERISGQFPPVKFYFWQTEHV